MLQILPVILDFFQDYFTSLNILSGLLLSVSFVAAAFSIYRFSNDSRTRSFLLLSVIVLSVSVWTFVLASLAFCAMLVNLYLRSGSGAISLVSELALGFSFLASPLSIAFLRNRARRDLFQAISKVSLKKIDGMESEERLTARVNRIFNSIKKMRIHDTKGIELSALGSSSSAVPHSLTFDFECRKVVAITLEAAEMLDDEELESVLAHEVGHIVNHDSALKSFVTSVRFAFCFDPVTRLAEAAFYREREFQADEFSARLTGNPASLASALIKMYHASPARKELVNSATVSLIASGGHRHNSGLLCRQPPIKQRINRLLRLADALD